jgi:hypothetical protein
MKYVFLSMNSTGGGIKFRRLCKLFYFNGDFIKPGTFQDITLNTLNEMKKQLLYSLTFLGLLASCEVQDNVEIDQPLEQQAVTAEIDLKMVEVDIPAKPVTNRGRLENAKGVGLLPQIKEINEMLIPYGVQLEKMEYFSYNEAGRVVFFSDRGNKQLNSDFVPNDPRNAGGTAVPYVIDGTQAITSSGLNTIFPTIEVMNTWDGVTCSDGLSIPFGGVSDIDLGFVSNIFFGFGGSPFFFPGVIVHAGVLPKGFFDLLAPGGGNGILGVCFTLTYIDDINQDGKGDVAIKEIYYNDNFNWQDVVATGIGIDYFTVSLHEVGHGLSQEHFGAVSGTPSNGKIQFSPRALMNAGYSGVNRVVAKTDQAGHCSNWGNWPNN